MAKLWASFSLKGVINRTREAGASALTPFQGRLLGSANRGQCLPFTPRYTRSGPWPFPAGKHAPHETASQSVPLFRPAQPLTTLPLCLIPFSSAQTHCHYNCHRLSCWVVSLSQAPSLSSTGSVSTVYIQVIFCFKSLQWKLMWPWRECLRMSFKPEEEERPLKVLSFMPLIDRRLSEHFFSWPVITMIRMGLNA